MGPSTSTPCRTVNPWKSGNDMPLLQQFMDILRSGGSESGQSQEAAEVAAQRTRRAVGPSPMNPTPQPIPEHLQSFKNYGKSSVDSLVTTFQDIVRNPESIVGTGELGMALPRSGAFIPLKQILSFRERGLSQNQAAKELGVNPATLGKRIKEYEQMGALEPVERPRTKQREHGFWLEGGEGYNAILKAIREDRPMNEVARDFGVTPATISQVAKKAGISIPPRAKPRVDVSDIEQLMDKGLTWKQIGARLGMTGSNAWQLAARNGLIDVEAIMDRKFNPGVKRQRKPGE